MCIFSNSFWHTQNKKFKCGWIVVQWGLIVAPDSCDVLLLKINQSCLHALKSFSLNKESCEIKTVNETVPPLDNVQTLICNMQLIYLQIA